MIPGVASNGTPCDQLIMRRPIKKNQIVQSGHFKPFGHRTFNKSVALRIFLRVVLPLFTVHSISLYNRLQETKGQGQLKFP